MNHPTDPRHSNIFVSFYHLKCFYQHFVLHIPIILKCPGVKGFPVDRLKGGALGETRYQVGPSRGKCRPGDQ